VYPSHVKRHFTLNVRKGKEFRDVTQFAFTAWPDHGVPTTTQELVDFRADVRQSWTPAKGRVAVHCSAGVGRTGTFIALDRFLEGVQMGKLVSLSDIVTNMRQDRNFMVQSQIQFIYLHHAALDAVHEALEACRAELQRVGMSEAEQEEADMEELNEQLEEAENMLDEQIEEGEDQLDEAYSKAPSKFPGPLPSRTGTLGRSAAARAARRASTAEGKYTDDLPKAARNPIALRRKSLAELGGHDSELWRLRRNIPLSLKEKGYSVDRARDLGQRLDALGHQVQHA